MHVVGPPMPPEPQLAAVYPRFLTAANIGHSRGLRRRCAGRDRQCRSAGAAARRLGGCSATIWKRGRIAAQQEGPLDLLLDLARAQRVDLAQLSIVTLVEQFAVAVDTAIGGQ